MNLYFTETNEQVELPQELTSFRGYSYVITRVAYPSGGGSSGKVETADGRYFYPGVFGCYIADKPWEPAA